MTLPEIQIERVSILTQSMICTLKHQGYTISDKKFDLDGGYYYINVYSFGVVYKRIIYDKDETLVEMKLS